ncbi:hypothetical protein J6590_023134 [Homalodisca vitripennis]|nr:hypothetical protein J6590_092972 [Homalodisca vitripennis]KAG8307365.1 hypothetical protein J6590_023134 [Homalodisca vitripennis]
MWLHECGAREVGGYPNRRIQQNEQRLCSAYWCPLRRICAMLAISTCSNSIKAFRIELSHYSLFSISGVDLLHSSRLWV